MKLEILDYELCFCSYFAILIYSIMVFFITISLRIIKNPFFSLTKLILLMLSPLKLSLNLQNFFTPYFLFLTHVTFEFTFPNSFFSWLVYMFYFTSDAIISLFLFCFQVIFIFTLFFGHVKSLTYLLCVVC